MNADVITTYAMNLLPVVMLLAGVITLLVAAMLFLRGEGRQALLVTVIGLGGVCGIGLPMLIRSRSADHEESTGQGSDTSGLVPQGLPDTLRALPNVVWMGAAVIFLFVILGTVMSFSKRKQRPLQEAFAGHNGERAAALSAAADTARRHLQPTQTEQPAGSSAAAPVASRERGQAVWEEALAQEGRILRKWQEYRSSVDMVLAYPSLSKLDDPLAVAASRAMLKTKRLRAATPPDPDGDPTTWAYVNAVDDLQHAFDLAVASARKRSAFSQKERELLDTALTVLTTIRTTTNPAEEAVNKRKLKKLLEDLPLDMPEAAMVALEAETRLQLTMGIDRRDKDLDFSLLSGGGPGSSAVAV